MNRVSRGLWVSSDKCMLNRLNIRTGTSAGAVVAASYAGTGPGCADLQQGWAGLWPEGEGFHRVKGGGDRLVGTPGSGPVIWPAGQNGGRPVQLFGQHGAHQRKASRQVFGLAMPMCGRNPISGA